MTRKTESIGNILHSTQTILEKSFPNTGVTKVSNHGDNFQRPLNQIFDVWELKETYPSRPPSPFPPKSMLVHFGDLEIHWRWSTLNRGAGKHFSHTITKVFEDFFRGLSESNEKYFI